MYSGEKSADEQGLKGIASQCLFRPKLKTRTEFKNLNLRGPTHSVRRKSQTGNGNLKPKLGDPSVPLPGDRTTNQETATPEAFIRKLQRTPTPKLIQNELVAPLEL